MNKVLTIYICSTRSVIFMLLTMKRSAFCRPSNEKWPILSRNAMQEKLCRSAYQLLPQWVNKVWPLIKLAEWKTPSITWRTIWQSGALHTNCMLPLEPHKILVYILLCRFLVSLRTYLESELPCLIFIRNRLQTSRAELAKSDKELSDIVKLNINLDTLVTELKSKCEKLASEIKEDETTLRALRVWIISSVSIFWWS